MSMFWAMPSTLSGTRKKGVQQPDERPRTLVGLLQEVLKNPPPYAPVLAYLQARQLLLTAPPVDCRLLHPDHSGDVRDRQKLRLSRCVLAVLHALSPFPFCLDKLIPLLQPSVPLAPRRTRRKEKGRTRARSEPYAPECVEVEFCELRHYGVLRSSSIRVSP